MWLFDVGLNNQYMFLYNIRTRKQDYTKREDLFKSSLSLPIEHGKPVYTVV